MKFNIVAYQGAGPIRFGMTEEELYACIGNPEDVRKKAGSQVECYYQNFTVRLDKDFQKVNEISFLADLSVELHFGDLFLDWNGKFVPKLCMLDGDAREALGFISLFSFGLLLADFFEGDTDPAITVVSRELMSLVSKDPVLDEATLKLKKRKFKTKQFKC